MNSKNFTLQDFKFFLNEAHKRDIKIIMDLVVNHTSTDSPMLITIDPKEKVLLGETTIKRNHYSIVKRNAQN